MLVAGFRQGPGPDSDSPWPGLVNYSYRAPTGFFVVGPGQVGRQIDHATGLAGPRPVRAETDQPGRARPPAVSHSDHAGASPPSPPAAQG